MFTLSRLHSNLLLFLFSFLWIFTNCSNSGQFRQEASVSSGGVSSKMMGYNELPKQTPSDLVETEKPRILIYNARLKVEVAETDSATKQVYTIASAFGGYVQTVGTWESVIRVKSNKLDSAVTAFAQLGRLTYKNIYGDDVTEEFYDTKIRLENAERSRKRYLELLDKAETVEAALKVEVELERVNAMIESMQGRIKRLSHLSEFSTITVQFEEKEKPGILGYVFLGVFKSVKWLFIRN